MIPTKTKNSASDSNLNFIASAKDFGNQISLWNARHPILAIVLVAVLAVAINCYPVIFCGCSYVSQSEFPTMVYSWGAPLPGNQPMVKVSQHGSDSAAMMLGGVPFGFVASRSVLEHGELPLWNRYGHAGDPFLGQAVTMLADPFQWIVILGRGCAGAWDTKYVLAKIFFCIGFGLLIRRLLCSQPLALLFTALAAYCGAFFYINNHLVFFVFCYAPWILLAALAWLDLETGKNFRWLLVWLLVNFGCFNGGHVEPAVDLIGCLNLAALAYALAQQRKIIDMAKVLGRISGGTLLFLGLTAPMWMSFLAALDGAYSTHMAAKVTQLPLTYLPGVFDDLLYDLFAIIPGTFACAPGTSFLVLAGTYFSILKWRQLQGEVFFWVNSSAIFFWGGVVFGWVPAALLVHVPFLNRVSHTYADFSYLLVVHLTIQCAYGFKVLAQEKNFGRMVTACLGLVLVIVGMMFFYCLANTHLPMPWSYFICATAGAVGAPLIFVYFKTGQRRITAIGWVAIIILGFIPNFRFGLYENNNSNDQLLLLPGSRVTLNAPSAAITKIQAENVKPFRLIGMDSSLFGDYSAVYGIEDIRSCVPLSSSAYINLVAQFPGMTLVNGWMLEVTDPCAAQPLLNLLNVKYVLVNPHSVIETGQGVDFRITDRSDFIVLENPEVWPRAYFSDRIVRSSSFKEFENQIWRRGKVPIAAFDPEEIKKQPGLAALENTNQPTIIPATNYRLLPNSTEFDIHASAAGVACLAESQANDFTATANHEKKTVLTVNRIFKAIYLDHAGDYHIEFVFRPRHWKLACFCLWLSIGTLIILGLASVGNSRCQNKKTADYKAT